jgi:uncharacterized membrane protein YccF (DUF307 family)
LARRLVDGDGLERGAKRVWHCDLPISTFEPCQPSRVSRRVRSYVVRLTMSPISLLLNVLWIIFGGLWMAFGWMVAAVIMAITIIGLPWARAAFTIAAYTLLPFGQKAVSRAAYSGREDVGTGPLGVIGNVIWLVLAGWWLALGHIVTAVLLGVTIIGIPFAWAHLKLAGLALWPIGMIIVPADDAGLGYRRR